jgi:hypothetical protein
MYGTNPSMLVTNSLVPGHSTFSVFATPTQVRVRHGENAYHSDDSGENFDAMGDLAIAVRHSRAI